MNAPLKSVSVVVPCYQEAGFIAVFVRNLFSQEMCGLSVELIIADGGSDDGTVRILEELKLEYDSLCVISNEQRIVSCGLNSAIMAASGDIIVRMDVHTEYASNYVAMCVEALLVSGADCVGGAWKVFKPNSGKARSIALAFDSKIGSGSALSRNDRYSGVCDTVYLGCWWKSYLIKIGLFDEDLVRNQDDELCLRIRKLGGKIYQSSEIKSTYFPRTEYTKLFNQWKQYGFWRPLVVRKHKSTGSIRQVVPAVFVLSCFAMVLLSFFLSSGYPIVIFTIAYSSSVIMAFCIQYPHESIPIIVRSIYAIAIIHFAYGWGFIRGSIFSIGSTEESFSKKNKISR